MLRLEITNNKALEVTDSSIFGVDPMKFLAERDQLFPMLKDLQPVGRDSIRIVHRAKHGAAYSPCVVPIPRVVDRGDQSF